MACDQNMSLLGKGAAWGTYSLSPFLLPVPACRTETGTLRDPPSQPPGFSRVTLWAVFPAVFVPRRAHAPRPSPIEAGPRQRWGRTCAGLRGRSRSVRAGTAFLRLGTQDSPWGRLSPPNPWLPTWPLARAELPSATRPSPIAQGPWAPDPEDLPATPWRPGPSTGRGRGAAALRDRLPARLTLDARATAARVRPGSTQ